MLVSGVIVHGDKREPRDSSARVTYDLRNLGMMDDGISRMRDQEWGHATPPGDLPESDEDSNVPCDCSVDWAGLCRYTTFRRYHPTGQ